MIVPSKPPPDEKTTESKKTTCPISGAVNVYGPGTLPLAGLLPTNANVTVPV